MLDVLLLVQSHVTLCGICGRQSRSGAIGFSISYHSTNYQYLLTVYVVVSFEATRGTCLQNHSLLHDCKGIAVYLLQNQVLSVRSKTSMMWEKL
jgi:hypothetical protein